MVTGARIVMNTFPVDIMRALISYDQYSGKLTWNYRGSGFFPIQSGKVLDNGWNERYCGLEALSIVDDKGYKHGRVLRKNFKAHRVAWVIHNGYWPVEFIDHINGDRSDNRICNLREATHSQNARNRVANFNSTSHYLGVHWNSRDSVWESHINDGSRVIKLGKFDTEVGAAKEYDKNAIKIHCEFARLNFS